MGHAVQKRTFGAKRGKKDNTTLPKFEKGKKEKYSEEFEDEEPYSDEYDDYPPPMQQKIVMNGKFDGRIIIENGNVVFDGKFDGEMTTDMNPAEEMPPYDDFDEEGIDDVDELDEKEKEEIDEDDVDDDVECLYDSEIFDVCGDVVVFECVDFVFVPVAFPLSDPSIFLIFRIILSNSIVNSFKCK